MTNGRIALCAAALLAMHRAAPAYDWLQYNGDPQHSGNNTYEAAIDVTNVAQLTRKFQVALPAVADGAPVFLEAVPTAGGTRDLLFVLTKAGHIVALDARTGVQVWSGQNPVGACMINNGGTPCYTTSSPAIDPDRQYVYHYGLDGYVHKRRVGDGVEITGGGWPQLVTLKGFDEKAAGALGIASANGTRYLYAVTGGYPGDNGDYQGHVTAIDLVTGTQKTFNTMCSDRAMHLAHNDPACAAVRSAVWARPGVVYHAPTNRILFSTGNGSYNGNVGGRNWSESVLAINPDGAGAAGVPLDSFTPANFQSLDNADADLGSTAPVLLPSIAGSRVAHLAVQGGKDALLRLVDVANLSGAGGPGHVGGEVASPIAVPQGGSVLSQPAVWMNPTDLGVWIFVANGNGISGLRVALDGAGNPSLAVQWQKAGGGFSPLVANNVLYYAGNNALRALDPTTGATLWSTTQIGGIHWQSPAMGNSRLYVLDQSGQLSAFGLPLSAASGTPQSTRVGTAFGTPLVVRLVDGANNPVANAAIAWSVPSIGATATLSTMTTTTDATGRASVAATAGAISGRSVVVAKSGTSAAAYELQNALAKAPGAGCSIPNDAVNDLIEQYYQAILRRASEAKPYWVNEVARLCALGVDPEQTFLVMASLFFDGPEYRSGARTDAAFVTDMHVGLFGRLPRVGELGPWTILLQQGLPRSSLLAAFLFSDEFGGVLDGLFAAAPSRAEVYAVVNAYAGILGRLPENSGFSYWIDKLRAAQCQGPDAVRQAYDDMSSGFINGPEYAARGRSEDEFVQDLYFGLLRRGAEPAGLAYWRAKLDSLEMTRDQVRQGFLASPETLGVVAGITGQGCAR